MEPGSYIFVGFALLKIESHVEEKVSEKPGTKSAQEEPNVEFVMFEDVQGQEIYVNPDHVVWVRELGDKRTVISCGHDHTFTVRLSPAQAVAVLGVKVR